MSVTFQEAARTLQNQAAPKSFLRQTRHDANNKSDFNLSFVLKGAEEGRLTRNHKIERKTAPISLRRKIRPNLGDMQSTQNVVRQAHSGSTSVDDDQRAGELLLSLGVAFHSTPFDLLNQKMKSLLNALEMDMQLHGLHTTLLEEIKRTSDEITLCYNNLLGSKS